MFEKAFRVKSNTVIKGSDRCEILFCVELAIFLYPKNTNNLCTCYVDSQLNILSRLCCLVNVVHSSAVGPM